MTSEVFVNSQSEALQMQIEGCRAAVELRDQVQALHKVPLFRELVMKKFMVEAAAEYVDTSANPAVPQAERADALAIAQAGGHLKRWFRIAIMMGNSAENTIAACEAELEQIRVDEQISAGGVASSSAIDIDDSFPED